MRSCHCMQCTSLQLVHRQAEYLSPGSITCSSCKLCMGCSWPFVQFSHQASPSRQAPSCAHGAAATATADCSNLSKPSEPSSKQSEGSGCKHLHSPWAQNSCRICFSAETHLAVYSGRVRRALLGSAVVQALSLQLAAGEAGEVHLQTAEHSCVTLRRRSLPLPQLWNYTYSIHIDTCIITAAASP